jgi:hypothetical protein
MRNFSRLIAIAILSGSSLLAHAQNCLETVLTIDSYMGIGGPAFVQWNLYNSSETQIDQGMAQFTTNDPFYDDLLCLAPGCYGIVANVPAIPDNPEALQISLSVNGTDLLLENYSELMGIIAFTFCVSENQDCMPVVATITNTIWPDGAQFACWNLEQGNLPVFQTCNEFNAEGQIVIEQCLLPGCYGVFVDLSTDLFSSALEFDLTVNGQPIDLIGFNNESYPQFEFCVEESVVDEDCPTSIFVGEGECGQYQFEIGSFQPGENVTWYLGENTLENQGHFLPFYQFEESGFQAVCAYYTSDLCPDGTDVCTIVNVDLCEPFCPEAITAIQQDCNSYVFYLADTPSVGVIWNFGDGTTQNGGIEIQHSFEDNGVFIVSATLETPDCPQGITLYYTVVLECGNDPECPTSIEYGSPECGLYNLAIQGAWPNESASVWYVDGVQFATGSSASFSAEAVGCYSIIAVYESDACGVIELSVIICLEQDCNTDPDCPTEIVVNQVDCNSFVFWIPGAPEAEVTWNFGDGVEQAGGAEIGYSFATDNEFMVTAYIDAPGCEQQVMLYTFVNANCGSEGNCPEILEVTNPECGVYVIHVAGSWPNEQNTAWYINGSLLAAGIGSSFEFVPEESGQYIITAQYAGQPCNDQIFLTAVIQFEGCNEDCAIELVPVYLGNGWWEFTAYGNPEEYPMWWTVDGGEPVAATWVYMIQLEPGPHVICATIEPESCPEPVSDCIEVVEEEDDDCTVVMLGMDSYVLQGGPNFIGWNIYDLNDNEVATGSSQYTNDDPFYDFSVCLDDGCYMLVACGGIPFTDSNFDFFIGETAELIWMEYFNEPGECIGMIAYFSVNSDCGDEECTQNEIELTVSGQYDNPNAIDLIELALSLEGVELNGFEIPLSADLNGTSTFCVPDGCYTVEISSAVPILAQFISITATVNGEPVDVEELLQGGTSLEFQVGAGVDCTDGVNDLEAGELFLYPNPARDVLTVQRSSSEVEMLTICDGAGRIVMQQSLNSPIQQVNLNELAPGMYVVRTGNLTHPLLIIR